MFNLAVRVMLEVNFELDIDFLDFDKEVRGKVMDIGVLLNLAMT